ncbi:hypothetical protein AAMO2058_000265900, partial [Amorphochlora amoebiformis]
MLRTLISSLLAWTFCIFFLFIRHSPRLTRSCSRFKFRVPSRGAPGQLLPRRVGVNPGIRCGSRIDGDSGEHSPPQNLSYTLKRPPQTLHLPPKRSIAGTAKIPGSKSISNRVLLLAALSSGKTILKGMLTSDDTQVLRDALKTLGAKIDKSPIDSGDAGESIIVHGTAGILRPIGHHSTGREVRLWMGNAGTAMRSMCAALCAAGEGVFILEGEPRMHQRPIKGLVDSIRQAGWGCTVEYLEDPG